MYRISLFALLLGVVITSCNYFSGETTLSSDDFGIRLDGKGRIVSLIDKSSGVDYYAHDSVSSLLSLQLDGMILQPQKMQYNGEENQIVLEYPENFTAWVTVDEKSNHLNFCLDSVSNAEQPELVIWGPFPTTINKVIGETVGVVQGENFAIGIQALNPKTLGGYPWNDNDCMPQLDIFESGDYSDLSEKNKRHVLYRVEAAKPADFGSTLQAYCRNRNKERVVQNWGKERYVAPAYDDGGIKGTKIALFGCPVEQLMPTIETIELEENLPHPVIDGKWGKIAPGASSAYMIMGFGEEDIEKALKMTKQAGLKYLYHPGPFRTWGHFEFNPDQFPDGTASMKKCVDKAKEYGIHLGLHTLSNFITTNDAYVTPVPDDRLAKVGSSILIADIGTDQTEIPVEEPHFFAQFNNNHLKTVQIGDELIRYAGVSESEPWMLTDCQRGSWGTKAAEHKYGETVSHLADHGYKVFLTNTDLSIEVAENIADIYNETGLRQISFDGLEGNRSTAMGNYGEILFTNAWYESLNDEIKEHYIADASRTSHYFWHMYTRMNWGEPWYAGFRESQTDYRLKNQAYFERNLMPAMLGWFLMKEQTSLEDIEWLLARSAGFDAGYAFVTGYKALDENGNTDEILRLIGLWEKARMNEIFTEEQKEQMKDINNEFHLEMNEEGEFVLTRIYSYKFKHEKKVRQPGEPLYSTFEFESFRDEAPVNFILQVQNATVGKIVMEVDHYKKINIPGKFKQDEILKYTGGDEINVYNNTWNIIRTIPVNPTQFTVKKGDHTLTFDCEFKKADNDALVKIEIRTEGEENRE